jgi:ABC-type oligopeptide transport system substrate-binding subunit
LARAKDKEPDPPAPAGSYRRPLGNDPRTLDPARISDIYGLSVTHQIFDGLVRFDHTLTISPALAQYWRSSRDGLTWTFTLRKGVKFHHGREVTATTSSFRSREFWTQRPSPARPTSSRASRARRTSSWGALAPFRVSRRRTAIPSRWC